MSDPVDLSVVTMLYRSEAWLPEFHRRATAAAEALTSSFEVVYVNDGSPDSAAALVRGLQRSDPRVVLVDLSRNFGHHQAAVAGLAQARGRRIFIIDVDLEEQPEWLARFAEEQDRTQADVVFGMSAVRRGTLFRRQTGSAFWTVFNLLSDVTVPPNPCTVRLMSRRYVRALLGMPEKNLFLAGSYAWLGFHQVPLVVEKRVRPTRSSYTLRRLLSLFLDAVTSFTSYPLRLIFLSGVFIAFAALLFGTLLAAWKVARPDAVALGWSSIIVTIAFLGVIGIYVSKVFLEVKDRPLYVVRSVETAGGRERDE